MPAGEISQLLDIIRRTSNLTDDEFEALVEACELRADNPGLPRSTVPDCGAHSQPQNTQLGAYLGQAEIARLLGISSALCRQWQRRGKLPPPSEYVGDRPMWTRKCVRDFCDGLAALAQAHGPSNLKNVSGSMTT